MSGKVKIVCPCCGARTYRSDIDSLLREVDKLWTPWREYLTVEQRELIQKMNTKERLEQILAQKGEIKMFCPICIFTSSVAIAQQIERNKTK